MNKKTEVHAARVAKLARQLTDFFLSYPCPTCGAAIGAPCTSVEKPGTFHRNRVPTEVA